MVVTEPTCNADKTEISSLIVEKLSELLQSFKKIFCPFLWIKIFN